MEIVQAITWLRTSVMSDILLEYEADILYWRGREMAIIAELHDVHALQHFFIQNGLGILEFDWQGEYIVKVGISHSPLATQYEAAQKTIALECGLVTEMCKQKYHSKAQGTATWIVPPDAMPYIEVTVHLEQP